MTQDKLIYTDGHDVVVTESTFKVKKMSYHLNGITKLSLWTIRPDRWAAVLVVLIGLVGVACGYLNLIPESLNMRTDNGYVSGNILALYIGAALALLGILILGVSRDKYAVRIGTAEGEKNAVVSRKREYIAQIVDALHSAFDLGHTTRPPVVVVKKK